MRWTSEFLIGLLIFVVTWGFLKEANSIPTTTTTHVKSQQGLSLRHSQNAIRLKRVSDFDEEQEYRNSHGRKKIHLPIVTDETGEYFDDNHNVQNVNDNQNK